VPLLATGNEAFNKVLEANIPLHVIRPHEYPDLDFARTYFIFAKYLRREFAESSFDRANNNEQKAGENAQNLLLVKSGFVLKGARNRVPLLGQFNWQRRWITVESDSILKYSDTKNSSVKGCISLRNSRISIASYETYEKNHCFVVSTPEDDPSHHGRDFLFICDNGEECIKWVMALRSHNGQTSPPINFPIYGSSCLFDRYCQHLRDEAINNGFIGYRISGTFSVFSGPEDKSVWEKKFIVLTSKALFFSYAADQPLCGVIPVQGASVYEQSNKTLCVNNFAFMANIRFSDAEFTEWKNAIQQAIEESKTISFLEGFQ